MAAPNRLTTLFADLSERAKRARSPFQPDALAGVAKSQRLSPTSVTASGKPTKQLERLFSGVQKYPFASVYVHGSWADDTRTAFSDLDDLVIVDVAKIPSKGHLARFQRWLNRVDHRFARVDPLQHHGHWLLDSRALRALDESYIPLHVLSGAICIQGPATVEASIDVVSTQEGLVRNVHDTARAIESLSQAYHTQTIRLYDLKRLVGSIAITPAYVFQSSGTRVSKREAIERARELYSDAAMPALVWATESRRHWSNVLQTGSFSFFSLFVHLIRNPHLYRRFASARSPKARLEKLPALEKSAVSAFVNETLRNC